MAQLSSRVVRPTLRCPPPSCAYHPADVPAPHPADLPALPTRPPCRPLAVDGDPVPVPHYGVALGLEQFQQLAERCRQRGVKFVIEPHLRFQGGCWVLGAGGGREGELGRDAYAGQRADALRRPGRCGLRADTAVRRQPAEWVSCVTFSAVADVAALPCNLRASHASSGLWCPSALLPIVHLA